MLQVQHLSKSYNEANVLKEIEFAVGEGEFFGILGPNGSGKSTLLKLLSGVEKMSSGRIRIDGSPIEQYSRKQLSRFMAVLQQESLPPVNFTVREIVEMGRYPYQNWLGEEKDDQSNIVDSILEKLRLVDMQDRSLQNLSGGERQRVALGKVMAQQPSLLLLDEPTTYLDIGYQVQMMDLVKAWQREEKLTVVAVLHDLNLASIYCDRMLMINQGEAVCIGTPEEIMRSELIELVYGTTPIVVEHPVHKLPQIMLQGGAFLE
ncbi:heme ABC transporter ATP-binding protein [Cohnella cholangitidis]|uniref:Heme ABC transporter ATP-binding protein n=1 Tax=Cohnella cholangitidis TaxID=2598458 RepID=A0A7G5BWZ6_9BACL|nr:heme ABC transporter ATP-binding protein [Cohnella cholangitidis]QMV41480.1 heme ABC transporter ATP-binding protein [Cohnella cholangitidis]